MANVIVPLAPVSLTNTWLSSISTRSSVWFTHPVPLNRSTCPLVTAVTVTSLRSFKVNAPPILLAASSHTHASFPKSQLKICVLVQFGGGAKSHTTSAPSTRHQFVSVKVPSLSLLFTQRDPSNRNTSSAKGVAIVTSPIWLKNNGLALLPNWACGRHWVPSNTKVSLTVCPAVSTSNKSFNNNVSLIAPPTFSHLNTVLPLCVTAFTISPVGQEVKLYPAISFRAKSCTRGSLSTVKPSWSGLQLNLAPVMVKTSLAEHEGTALVVRAKSDTVGSVSRDNPCSSLEQLKRPSAPALNICPGLQTGSASFAKACTVGSFSTVTKLAVEHPNVPPTTLSIRPSVQVGNALLAHCCTVGSISSLQVQALPSQRSLLPSSRHVKISSLACGLIVASSAFAASSSSSFLLKRALVRAFTTPRPPLCVVNCSCTCASTGADAQGPAKTIRPNNIQGKRTFTSVLMSFSATQADRPTSVPSPCPTNKPATIPQLGPASIPPHAPWQLSHK